MLNTDAHGVMHTNLLIKMFQRNKMSIQLDDKTVFCRDLSPEQQQRFDPQRLRECARDYEKTVRQAEKSDRSR